MQAAGVATGADDGRIRKPAAVADEFVLELGFHLIFPDARSGEVEHAAESPVGEVAGFADEIEFELGFNAAQTVHQRGEPLEIVDGITADGIQHEAGFATFHLNDGALVLVGVEKDMIALAHQPVEQPEKLGQPMDVLNAGQGARGGFVQFAALPNLILLGRLAEEQDFPVLLFIGIRINDQDGLFLFDAGKVEQVRINDRSLRAIGIGGAEVIGIDHHQRVLGQQGGQSTAVFNKQF